MIDTFANRIVGWKASRSAKTDFVLPSRQIATQSPAGQRMHLSRRFMPAVQPIRAALFITAIAAGNTCPFATPSDWQRRALSHPLAASATPMIEPVDAIGSRSRARALAETINGLYKTEVIRRRSSWKSMEEVELETLKWPYGDASIAYRLTGRLVQQQAPA